MKRTCLILALLGFWCVPAWGQNSASGNISASSTNCTSVPSSCVWEQPLPPNAGTSTVSISGTFSATLLVEESNNAGLTWSTAATLSAAGITTYSVNGLTDIRVRCSAYVSGTAAVSISTGLNTGLIGPAGPAGSGGGISSPAVGGTYGGSPSSGYTFTSTPITTAPFNGNLVVGANINNNDTGSYTAGTGYTLIASTVALGFEYLATAGAASSFSSAFTYSVNSSTWGGDIAVFSSPGANAVLVQGTAAGTVTALAYGSNNVAGHLLVGVFRYNTSLAGGPPITSVTDTVGNTWVLAGRICPEGYSKGQSTTNNFLEMWYAVNSGAGANTVTLHGLTGSTSVHMGIAEFSGIATSAPLVDYNFTGSTVGATSLAGATTNAQYLIQAVNNATGTVDFSGRDSGLLVRNATAAKASVGGILYFKDGVYPGQTSVQETVAGQSNWFVWGLAAPVGNQNVSWHFVCESTSQVLYANLQQAGCIHQIMPSAYSGPAPGGAQLSGLWQRPNATFGAKDNNGVFLVNGVFRIPDNQVSSTVPVDVFTSTYSSHIGTVVDTAIAATDQLCSGLASAASNVTGFRSNQFGTDETYFENTWVVGYNTAMSIQSNHFFGINMHSACSVNAANITIGGSLYGGELYHFQDIHNINGIILNCQAGTRFIFSGIVENAQSGTFARSTNATETAPGNCVGKVDVTTGSANSVAFNPAPFFASGSGANVRVNDSTKLLQPGLVTSNFTSAATTGTSKQTLATYTFVFQNTAPGPQNGPFINNPGGVIRFKAWGITAANGDSKTFEIDFGGTAIATITSTVNAGSIKCEAEIIVSSVANTQEVLGYCDDGTTRTVTRTAPGITGNANIITNIAATTGTASGDFTFKGLTIEYVGGS